MSLRTPKRRSTSTTPATSPTATSHAQQAQRQAPCGNGSRAAADQAESAQSDSPSSPRSSNDSHASSAPPTSRVWLSKPIPALDDDKPIDRIARRIPSGCRLISASRIQAQATCRQKSQRSPCADAGSSTPTRITPLPDTTATGHRWQRGDIVDGALPRRQRVDRMGGVYRRLGRAGIPPAHTSPATLWTWEIHVEVATFS